MDYPIKLSMNRPENSSRILLLARTFLGFFYIGIPHGIALFVISLGAMFVSFIAFFAVLFTGKYPQGMFNYMAGLMRWRTRVGAYSLFLTDKYPPFSMKETDYPVSLTVEYPQNLSRLLLLARAIFGFFYIYIPHGICLMLRAFALYFIFIYVWFAILFTGKYPESAFNFVSGTMRWGCRVAGYSMFMTDKYPPFTGKE